MHNAGRKIKVALQVSYHDHSNPGRQLYMLNGTHSSSYSLVACFKARHSIQSFNIRRSHPKTEPYYLYSIYEILRRFLEKLHAVEIYNVAWSLPELFYEFTVKIQNSMLSQGLVPFWLVIRPYTGKLKLASLMLCCKLASILLLIAWYIDMLHV